MCNEWFVQRCHAHVRPVKLRFGTDYEVERMGAALVADGAPGWGPALELDLAG
jgi:hypothetical protein